MSWLPTRPPQMPSWLGGKKCFITVSHLASTDTVVGGDLVTLLGSGESPDPTPSVRGVYCYCQLRVKGQAPYLVSTDTLGMWRR